MVRGFPVPISVPPHDPVNQCTSTPEPPVALRFIVPASSSQKLFSSEVTNVGAVVPDPIVTVYVAVAVSGKQALLLVTVIVRVTVLPSSEATELYVGVKVLAFDKLPLPSCVHIMVPLLAEAPLTVAAPLEQMVSLPPAEAVGCGSTLTACVAVAVCGLHALLLVTVMVSVTVLPASELTALYVGVSVVASDNEPFPLCVQLMVPLLAEAPLTVAAPFEQMVSLPPAEAVGCGSTLTACVAVAVCGLHALLLVTVMVSVTVLPASELTALYVGVSVVASDNEPFPLCVQLMVPLLAEAPLTVAAPFEQMVSLPPAEAVGWGSTLTAYVAVAVCGLHVLLLVTVMVSVTVLPASELTALYVGVSVVASDNKPFPLCVQLMVPLLAEAPLTVAAPFEQMV